MNIHTIILIKKNTCEQHRQTTNLRSFDDQNVLFIFMKGSENILRDC